MSTLFLVFTQQGREAFRIPLPERGAVSLGRAPDCGVCLPDPDRVLSRVHCELRVRPGGVFVVDRSFNGTHLAEAPLRRGEPRLFRVGPTLSLGNWQVEIRRGEPGNDASSGLSSTFAPSSNGLAAAVTQGDWHGMRADSPPMMALFTYIERVAAFAVPVLVVGETGTGKELVARAVHSASPRARKRLVAVNCGAIHGETAHSRLFGHEKGAFTGASSDSAGAFREADGGTLFLDEIGELSMLQQTALLRVLERREVVPMGSSRPVPVDYRLVAATHRDLPREVAAGRFREDLYYRLDVAVLRVPPLRERASDIPGLARHFLAVLASGTTPDLTTDAVELLLDHSWPGNVRELRNTMLRALLASDGGPIEPRHVAIREAPRRPALFAAEPMSTWEQPPVAFAAEKARILGALDRAAGNRKEAARLLGVARSTLYSRMHKLGLS